MVRKGMVMKTSSMIAALISFLLIDHSVCFQKIPFPTASTRKLNLVDKGTCGVRTLRASVDPIFDATNELLASPLTSSLPTILTAFGEQDIQSAFKFANFFPQPFFLLMVFAPKWKVTEAIMKPWWVPITAMMAHLFIVIVSATIESDIVAPLSLLGDVFDPSGDPFKSMQQLMQYPGFVAEEWPHVLIWDLFVGRWIWIDGLNRGVFTSHSVLLTNFIGPPGFLLHTITSVASGKGLPSTGFAESIEESNSINDEVPETIVESDRADKIILELFQIQDADDARTYATRIAAKCSSDVVFEDLSQPSPIKGREAIQKFFEEEISSAPAQTQIIVKRVAEGVKSSGFTWSRYVEGVGYGLRGTTFLKLNDDGEICFIQQVAEPLLKPGGVIANLLKNVAKPSDESKPETPFVRRDPISAPDAVNYLWNEAQDQDFEEALRIFSDDIFYEDFNYPNAFLGKEEVNKFLGEFDIPGLRFVPELISEGEKNCCFTWNILIDGVDGPAARGISFYTMGEDGKIDYIRDIPGAAIKPAPLQKLAKSIRPGIQRFQPLETVA